MFRVCFRELVPHGADLEDHDADSVGDGVVQLAGDPGSLFGRRDARGDCPLALGADGPLFRRLGVPGAFPQGQARAPDDREQHRDEDELAAGVTGVVVNHDRRAAHHDGQADPSLPGVTEVAEQERGDHRRDERADRGHHQLPVDEGDRHAKHPVRRGGGERKPVTAEKCQDHQRHRRRGEPRRPLSLVPERHLDRALGRHEHYQNVQRVPACQ